MPQDVPACPSVRFRQSPNLFIFPYFCAMGRQELGPCTFSRQSEHVVARIVIRTRSTFACKSTMPLKPTQASLLLDASSVFAGFGMTGILQGDQMGLVWR
ncbi:MAG TPA: hypothetical protein VFL42_07625, partial [Terriglobales bacterium]|nr:hypothetical protein [Terriglobales bacterium]